MGGVFRCCFASSKVSNSTSQNIDEEMRKDLQEDMERIKLLLLGSGESGKSTLFKQMITLYGNGYTQEQRAAFKIIIQQNIMSAIKELINAPKILVNYEIDEIIDISSETQELSDIISSSPNELQGKHISPELSKNISLVWQDPGIQLCYKHRRFLQFPDSGKYFLDKVEEVCEPSYFPSQDDILHSRVKTTGIIETEFKIVNKRFKLYDVGGQRTERKKWIHCFEAVTCVIFVAAISEYDQFLYEDGKTNRMAESLALFDETCNSEWFRNTSMILFLNKRDLFQEKIKTSPLTDYVEDFEGDPMNYQDCCDYMTQAYSSLNRHPEKTVYIHITCATDTNNIEHVFNSVRDTLIKESLRDGGFM